VVNGNKSAAHTDSPDGGTGKTCLGGGMHCPITSSCNSVSLYTKIFFSVASSKFADFNAGFPVRFNKKAVLSQRTISIRGTCTESLHLIFGQRSE